MPKKYRAQLHPWSLASTEAFEAVVKGTSVTTGAIYEAARRIKSEKIRGQKQ